MSPLEIVGSVVGTLVGLVVLGGVAWKVVILPNLREQLFKPVQETARQVTVNGGKNNPATLLDKVGAIDAKLDDHLTWSREETQRLWDAIAARKPQQP